ncbi:unnamed protein product [Lactuca virosa]|uniref:Uncharacterized protein n=1 Tax=Lactuca virosa TaxID=75947 RepID=A0AAU9ML73_9ASTR|nr:unnamed protein product [Lactuca virosa]
MVRKSYKQNKRDREQRPLMNEIVRALETALIYQAPSTSPTPTPTPNPPSSLLSKLITVLPPPPESKRMFSPPTSPRPESSNVTAQPPFPRSKNNKVHLRF